jgi:glycosyltransferase involved in cell wall biosynthesis
LAATAAGLAAPRAMTLASNPTISVLMPIHNAERFVREALDGILEQTYRDFEVVAVDNASSDRSRTILNGIQRDDARVRVVECPEKGIVPALNAGLGFVRGEMLARMDADDTAMPTRLERQLTFLRDHPEVVAVGCRCLVVDEQDDPLEIRGLVTDHGEIERALLGGTVSVLCHSSMMFRTEAVRTVGGYRSDVGVSEDLALYLRIAELGKLANISDVVMRIRRWPESTTARQTSADFAWSRERIINEALQRRALPQSYVDRRQWVFVNRTDGELYRAGTALTHGFRRTAVKYAWRAVRHAPWRTVAWKVLGRALLTRPPL